MSEAHTVPLANLIILIKVYNLKILKNQQLNKVISFTGRMIFDIHGMINTYLLPICLEEF